LAHSGRSRAEYGETPEEKLTRLEA